MATTKRRTNPNKRQRKKKFTKIAKRLGVKLNRKNRTNPKRKRNSSVIPCKAVSVMEDARGNPSHLLIFK